MRSQRLHAFLREHLSHPSAEATITVLSGRQAADNTQDNMIALVQSLWNGGLVQQLQAEVSSEED